MKNKPVIKHAMVIGFSTAKFLLEDVDVVHPSNNSNNGSSLISRRFHKLPMKFLHNFPQMSKSKYKWAERIVTTLYYIYRMIYSNL